MMMISMIEMIKMTVMMMMMMMTCQSLSSRAALVAASSGRAISYTSVGIRPTWQINDREDDRGVDHG